MISSNNAILGQLTGYNGLGMGSLVFNWKTLTQDLGSPVLVPRWAVNNLLIGFVIFICLLIPAVYYSNVWNFQRMPIATSLFFKPNGDILTRDLKGIILNSNITAADITFDCTTVVTYYLVLGCFVALVVHTILYHGTDLLQQFRTSLEKRENDIHCTLMSKYHEAPEWWYISVFVIAFVLSVLSCYYGHFMPWYYLFIVVPFAILTILPTGIVEAKTSIPMSTLIAAQMLGAAIFDGNLIPTYTFMIYGYQLSVESKSLIRNIKFGHFMKISARTLFATQLLVTIISIIIKYSVTSHLLKTVKNLCDHTGPWACSRFDVQSIVIATVGKQEKKRLW
ncbi:unnamed protein product [Didymodactylos carnosus]|nr:unnamed protein product [Didymodactylos carnosus]CAF4173106.1 unnamed protein product [Didymodactylos carnosus]